MHIESDLNPHGSTFQARRKEMIKLVEAVRELEAKVITLSEKKREKFERRGQLMPRDRVALLLDRGRPIIELCSLAGLGMHDDNGKNKIQGGNSFMGIGWVSDVRVLVYAHNSAIKGGAISPMGVKKALRAQEIALQNRLPMVTLAESAGANLQYQSELFVEGGRTFANQAKLSAAGIPQVTVVHGSSTAGGAYVPGLSDYVIMVQKRAKVFLAGPPLVQAATGEISTDEELGGADMHFETTGLNEYIAPSDHEAILIARQIVASLNWKSNQSVQSSMNDGALVEHRPPRYSPDELCGVVPVDYRQPYDPREVIARLIDDSDFLEFKSGYGSEIVTGHAEVYGQAVGIIANQGPIMPEGSVKTAQFIQLCCQSHTPILFLQNTTGFMVGKDVERNGMVKHGSKMIQAVANATVPKITFLIGGAFGAGHYAMCGRAYDPRFIFAWPNNRLSVMGGQQAGEVMKIITRQNFARQGKVINEQVETQLQLFAQPIIDKIDQESSALFATARIWDDGIIDPRDSRRLLGELLSVCNEAEAATLKPNIFGVARM
jgi:geranyl-CoA carboxylase beta subunit